MFLDNDEEAKLELGKVYNCRICYDETCDRGEVIVPCLCSGSGKYICLDCLEDWRVNGSSSKSFTHCPTCEFEYHLESNCASDAFAEGKMCGILPATWLGRKSYFRYLVFSDFAFGLFIINVYLIFFGIFLRWLDYDEVLVNFMPWDSLQDHVEDHHVIRGFKHHKATYYSASLFITLFFILVIATWQYFLRCDTSIKRVRDSISYDNKMSLWKVIALFAVFIFLKVFAGAFIALISVVAWMQRAATRHMHILVKKEIAQDFRVVDLELTGRLRHKAQVGDSDGVSASAPPKSHSVASLLLMERLLKIKIHVE